MMDDAEIRKQLKDARLALKRTEEEREVWISMIKGFEGLLRLRGLNGHKPTQPPLADIEPTPTTDKAPAFRQAVLQVVRDAQGEPLHVGEILRRALRLGAKTGSKNPENSTDLTLYKWLDEGVPVEKTQARTWKYIEPLSA